VTNEVSPNLLKKDLAITQSRLCWFISGKVISLPQAHAADDAVYVELAEGSGIECVWWGGLERSSDRGSGKRGRGWRWGGLVSRFLLVRCLRRRSILGSANRNEPQAKTNRNEVLRQVNSHNFLEIAKIFVMAQSASGGISRLVSAVPQPMYSGNADPEQDSASERLHADLRGFPLTDAQ